MAFLAAGVFGYTVGRMAEQGLADSLGLTTRRHGTDPLSWVKIHLFGATPQDDVSQLGAKVDTSKPYFTLIEPSEEYVLNLPDLKLSDQISGLLPDVVNTFVTNFIKKYFENKITTLLWKGVTKLVCGGKAFANLSITTFFLKKTVMYGLPFVQKVDATYKQVKAYVPFNSRVKAVFAFCASSAIAALTPSIKFRYNENNKADFSEIKLPMNIVQLSEKKISVSNIGLLGTLKNGIRLGNPICFGQPVKVIQGIVFMALAGAIATGGLTIAPGILAAHQAAIITGVALACI
jgi:hypothetical protein